MTRCSEIVDSLRVISSRLLLESNRYFKKYSSIINGVNRDSCRSIPPSKLYNSVREALYYRELAEALSWYAGLARELAEVLLVNNCNGVGWRLSGTITSYARGKGKVADMVNLIVRLAGDQGLVTARMPSLNPVVRGEEVIRVLKERCGDSIAL